MDRPTEENPPSRPRIREVDASHIAELIGIAEETNLSHWSAQSYLDEMKNPEAIMLRLEGEDNSTVGFVVGRFVIGGEIEIVQDAEIYNIAVSVAEQGNGLGQMLIDAFAEECRKRECSSIWLEVRESNKKAIAFYERNGFQHIQTRPSFYENPREHALLMKLALK